MSIAIVKEVNGRVYLDNGVFVDLIDKDYCPRCKQVSEENQLCYDCKYKDYSFNSVLTFGYYIGRWYNLSDAFIVPKKNIGHNIYWKRRIQFIDSVS